MLLKRKRKKKHDQNEIGKILGLKLKFVVCIIISFFNYVLLFAK